MCLRVTEKRDLLLTASSHATLPRSFLFHCLPTSPPCAPAWSIIGNCGCVRLPTGRLPSGVSLPRIHPAERGSTLQSQGKADSPGKWSCWESRAQHPVLWSPLWLSSCPGIATPGASRRTMGAGRRGTLLDAALTSLGHMGPWMLPPALAARGWRGAPEPPPGSRHGRAHHTSPAASRCGFWHTRPLRNRRLCHGSQESQGREGRAAQLPLTRVGHPYRAMHPKAPTGPAALPRRPHGPTIASSSHDAAPSTKPQH